MSSRRQGVRRFTAAIALAVLVLAGACGGAGTASAPQSSVPSFVSAPTETLAAPETSTPTDNAVPASPDTATLTRVARMLAAKGFDCADPKPSDRADPGATAQVHCGLVPALIEIAVFPDHDAITTLFAPFLSSYFCGSSSSDVTSYIDGGTWAIYTNDGPTTAKIGTALGIAPTSLC
jgi:hypothetical protein